MHSRCPFSALGAEIEPRGYLPAAARAPWAFGLETIRLTPARLIKDSSTTGALQEPLSPLDRDDGDEE